MSKSKNDRGKTTPSAAQNLQPVVQNFVVPGKFLDSDWNDLVETESNEEFIFDIILDLVNVTCNNVFQSVIDSRVQPFAVFMAKELVLEAIQWQFLECDHGEKDTLTDASWIEDDEPLPSVTDSWAQGAVPVVPVKTMSPIHESVLDLVDDDGCIEDREDSIPSVCDETDGDTACIATVDGDRGRTNGRFITLEERHFRVLHSEMSLLQGDNRPLFRPLLYSTKESADAVESSENTSLPTEEIITTEDTAVVESTESENTVQQPQPPNKQKKAASKTNRHKKFKPYNGSVPNFQPISLSPVTTDRASARVVEKLNSSVLHSSESLLRTQHGRPPGNKPVVYDDRGNVLYVQKMKVNDLPKQCVNTKYKIIDISKEQEKQLRLSSKHKLKTQRSKYSDENDNHLHSISNTSALIRRLYGDDPDVMGGLRTPLPPPILDAIDVAGGVLVREGGMTKKGPKNQTIASDSKDDLLQPMSATTPRVLKANDIVSNKSPAIRSLSSNKPLPPILS